LQVYPGTHHVLAKHLRDKGPNWMYDGKKEKPTPMKKWPKLSLPNISDCVAYQLCVEAGDVVLAHPWLAHGIGLNTSSQTRLACYARFTAKQFFLGHQRNAIEGRLLASHLERNHGRK